MSQEHYSEGREALMIGPELASRHELLARVAQEIGTLLSLPKTQKTLAPLKIQFKYTDNPKDLPGILKNWTALIGHLSRYRRYSKVKIEMVHFDELRKRIKEVLTFFEISDQDEEPGLLSARLPPPKRISLTQKLPTPTDADPEDLQEAASEILDDGRSQEENSD